jgi:hypothetical protein
MEASGRMAGVGSQALTLGRVVHAWIRRGSTTHGPIAAIVVAEDPPELSLLPGTEHAWLIASGTSNVFPVSKLPGLDKDQTIPQVCIWEWPERK